jgi:hypothetical protein
MPWKLTYSFAGTPVSAALFYKSLANPVIAAAAMSAVLLLVRATVDSDSALVSLGAGAAAAMVAYFLTFAIIPGGWMQLCTLFLEVTGVIRGRSK